MKHVMRYRYAAIALVLAGALGAGFFLLAEDQRAASPFSASAQRSILPLPAATGDSEALLAVLAPLPMAPAFSAVIRRLQQVDGYVATGTPEDAPVADVNEAPHDANGGSSFLASPEGLAADPGLAMWADDLRVDHEKVSPSDGVWEPADPGLGSSVESDSVR